MSHRPWCFVLFCGAFKDTVTKKTEFYHFNNEFMRSLAELNGLYRGLFDHLSPRLERYGPYIESHWTQCFVRFRFLLLLSGLFRAYLNVDDFL